MARLIDVEDVCKEIDRFKGYLNEDMIVRLKIAVKRLPTVEAISVEWIEDYANEYIDASYLSVDIDGIEFYPYQEQESIGHEFLTMIKDWEKENEQNKENTSQTD